MGPHKTPQSKMRGCVNSFCLQDAVEWRFNLSSWRFGPSLSECCAAGRIQQWRRRRRPLLPRRPFPSCSAWRWCWRAARTGNHQLEREAGGRFTPKMRGERGRPEPCEWRTAAAQHWTLGRMTVCRVQVCQKSKAVRSPLAMRATMACEVPQ